MNYSKLRKSIDQKTKKLIEDENWDELLRILKICPEQIYFFSVILEEKLKVSKELNEFPVLKIKYEHKSQDDPDAPFVYYRFTKIFNLIFELLNFKRDFLSKEFKYQLCEILYPKITEFLNNKRYRISSIEKFINSFYDEIHQIYYDEFINHLFLLEYLNKEKQEDLVEFFPKIVSKGLYRIGYELIINFNELIKQYGAETRQILEKIILYEKQYYSLRELLEKENKELIEIMEDNRKNLKQEFYKKFLNYTREILDSEFFERNPEDTFRYTFDLYTDEELTNLIKKIIELEITHSHYGKRIDHTWINLLLLDITWGKKSLLFEEYLEDLASLGYLQVVRSFFIQNPEKIKAYLEFILQELGSFGLDLLERKYQSFDIENPLELFKKLLYEKNYYLNILTKTFFENNPNLILEFKDIMIKYIEEFDFEIRENLQTEYYKIENLLRYIYIYYPPYPPDFNISLFQKFYKKIPLNPELAEVFNHSYNYKIPDHFNLFEKSLQKQIINYFIESKNLSEIEFFLTRKFQNFEDYLPNILEFEPKHELQSEHFIKVLELIIKKKGNDSILKRQLVSCLSKQKCCLKKAEVYSFLGELKLSKDVLEKLLENERIIPYLINIYLDYQLVKIELCAENSELLDLSEYLDELKEIENTFEVFNTSQSIRQNFVFKLSSYKARLNLYRGFQYLNEYNYEISKDAFRESLTLYNGLKETTGIKEDTKQIFKTYWKLSKFFYEYIPTIERLREVDIYELNSIIKEHLKEYTKDLPKSNLQIERITKKTEDIQFIPKTKSINQFRCEIPTKFCPKPPIPTFKRLSDANKKIIFEWDKDDKPSSTEPIEISVVWKKYYLELEFAEKEKYFDFKLEYEQKHYFKIEDVERKPPQSGKECFEFWLNFEEFIGVEDMLFRITEDNLCGSEIKVSFPIVHKFALHMKLEDIKRFVFNLFAKPGRGKEETRIFQKRNGLHTTIINFIKKKLHTIFINETHNFRDEAGTDLILRFLDKKLKIGVSLEATSDIAEIRESERKISYIQTILSKITDSKRIKDLDLFVILFCIDKTVNSYEKTLGITLARLEMVNDPKLIFIPPEQLIDFFKGL